MVETITEQIGLVELQFRVARLFVIDAQERSLLRPCRFGKLEGCWACKIKRHILRERYN